jgi:3'(2'), 5'-bisphosphate nucleotidase
MMTYNDIRSLHNQPGENVFKSYREEAEFAFRAVQRASRLCDHIQDEMVTDALAKSDRSPVTVADFASQALVGQMIESAFPDDPLVAEEDSAALREPTQAERLNAVARFLSTELGEVSNDQVCNWIDRGMAKPASRFWTLDPIDGTKGFLRGDQYVTAMALIVGGEVVVGALGCPNLNTQVEPDFAGGGCTIAAVRGEGAWTFDKEMVSGKRLRVSVISDAAHARVLRSFESGHTDTRKIDALTEQLEVIGEPVLMDSQAKYALLAAGRGDLLFRLLSPDRSDYKEKIWDQAAGALIVEEAGGRITDLYGDRLDFNVGRLLANNTGVLASNGHLHEKALAALGAVGVEPE